MNNNHNTHRVFPTVTLSTIEEEISDQWHQRAINSINGIVPMKDNLIVEKESIINRFTPKMDLSYPKEVEKSNKVICMPGIRWVQT